MGSGKKHKKDRDSSSSASASAAASKPSSSSTSTSKTSSNSASSSTTKHKDKLIRAPSPPEFRLDAAASTAGDRHERSDRNERSDRDRERDRERRHRADQRDKPVERSSRRDRSRERERSRDRTHHGASSSGGGSYQTQYTRRRPPVADEYHSDDSDVVEVPIAPPAPKISAATTAATAAASGSASARRSASPIPANGAGDCLSVAETNKLRAKLGLKPLDLGDGAAAAAQDAAADAEPPRPRDPAHANLSAHKDEWGEFLHKPADNLAGRLEAEKLREKIRLRREKRMHEERLKRVRKLGDEDDIDDINVWLDRSRDKERNRVDAAKRAAALREQDDQLDNDAELEHSATAAREAAAAKRKATYSERHLKGLKVGHELDAFGEGKTVILTLKDQDVLDEAEGDALINVNMVDDERYKKNIANRKQTKNPNAYGYDVYEEQYDLLGNPIERNILSKYDEDLEESGASTSSRKAHFTIGESHDDERQRQRRLQEIKTKLAGKRLETLDEPLTRLASDTYTEDEIQAKFKKPKRKVKKLRQKLKADDLVPMPGDNAISHHGRRQRQEIVDTDDVKHNASDLSDVKLEEQDDDLELILAKARRLKQKEALIVKSLSAAETDIKAEPTADADGQRAAATTAAGSSTPSVVAAATFAASAAIDANIVLNSTAEFCRTLGDIPTYGMSGNRDVDAADMMDDYESDGDDLQPEQQAATAAAQAGRVAAAAALADEERSTGTWNSVNPDAVERPADAEAVTTEGRGQRGGGDVAILDEEPDVGSGMGAALKLALSKGYLEKEDQNRPSNTRMAHLQAKNYSIEDKAYGDDDKFQRRDRFQHGPVSDFKERDNYRPNVKLEYIDDSGRLLNEKEAFRYLSHKFHGKGPGKNKIEKRLKKNEQDGVSDLICDSIMRV